MKPALRLSAQKSLKIPYALAIPHLSVLAQKGPSHLKNVISTLRLNCLSLGTIITPNFLLLSYRKGAYRIKQL